MGSAQNKFMALQQEKQAVLSIANGVLSMSKASAHPLSPTEAIEEAAALLSEVDKKYNPQLEVLMSEAQTELDSEPPAKKSRCSPTCHADALKALGL